MRYARLYMQWLQLRFNFDVTEIVIVQTIEESLKKNNKNSMLST